MSARIMDSSELSPRTRALFEAYDRGDTNATVAMLATDCSVTFGNNPPITGRLSVKEALDDLATMLKRTSHAFLNEWVVNADTIVEYIVTYELTNGRSVSVPGSTIFTSDNTGLVSTYRVYIDQTPVFAD